MIGKIAFTHYSITDMERSVDFYKNVLGLSLLFKMDEWTEFAIGAQRLAIHKVDKVPPPKIESYGLKGAKTKVLESDFVIEAPIGLVFNVLSDHSIRHYWSDKIKDSDHLNGAITHNGSTHRCLINDNKNDPFIVAHDFKAEADNIVFTETDSNIGFSEVYELRSTELKATRIRTYTFVEGKYLKPLIFRLFIKNKLIEGKTEQNIKLNDYCKNLLLEGKSPKTQIVLK